MKKIMIAFREGGENGGPYNSHLRIMNSSLAKEYQFVPLYVPKGKMGLFNHKLLKLLVKQIEEAKPDAVHVVGLEMIGYYLVLACKKAKVKNIILAIHGSTTEAIELNKNIFKRYIMLALESYTLRNATITYGVSKYVGTIPSIKKHVRNYFGHIYNMVFLHETDGTVGLQKSELQIDDGKLIVTSTGRITKEKGFDTLTQVIKRFENREEVVFVIAGDGKYLPEMRERLASQVKTGQVHLLGFREDIPEILRMSDIFIMPSRHETLCMSLIEAGQCGLALIASKVGGMKEVVSEGNGYLVDAEDVDGFVEKIDFLIHNRSLLEEMKQNAKNTIANQFDNRIAEERLLDLYRKILGENDK